MIVLILLAALGLISARWARRRLRRLTAQVTALEARVARLERLGGSESQASSEAVSPASDAPPTATGLPLVDEIALREAALRRDATSLDDFAAADGAAEPDDFDALAERANFSPPARAPSRSWEELLGAKWSVLVGGAALALGGLLLVRYSIEAGLLGPAARVASGLALGLGLVAGGEAARRRGLERVGRASIPATLTAAGTVALFGSIYAAHAIYGFIGSPAAFLLLGATGLGTLAAAALHGPGLAAIGLLGSFVAPMLVSSQRPSPWPVMFYVIVVSIAAYGLARLRGWFWLAVATLAGAAGWQTILLAASGRIDFAHAAVAHGLAQTGLALGVFAWPYRPFALTPKAAPSATLAPALQAALAMLAVAAAFPPDAAWGSLAVFAALAATAALAVVAIEASAAAPLLAVAGLAALWTGVVWPRTNVSLDWRDLTWTSFAQAPVDPAHFLAVLAALAALLLGAAVWRLDGRRRPAPVAALAIWGAAGTGGPLALLALAFAGMTGWSARPDWTGSWSWAAAAAVLASVFTLATARARTQQGPAAEQAAGWFATGALAALALGLVFALSEGTLTIALSLAALAGAFVAARLGPPALRWGAAGLGLLVALRVAWNPLVAREVGATPFFNWLLLGYGAPALAFAGAARLLRGREDLALQTMRALAIFFAGALIFLEIRHAANAGNVYADAFGLAEAGAQVLASLLFGIGLAVAGRRTPALVYRVGEAIAGLATTGMVAGALAFTANPLLTDAPIAGGPLFNTLILAYFLPATAAIAYAVVLKSLAAPSLRAGVKSRLAAFGGLFLLFAYVTLETRRLFQGPEIGLDRGASDAEATAYSATWLALGLAALAYGVVRKSKEARIGSAALVVMATLKIFLYDLSGVGGAWRAFSFIGLGLALIGVGVVYQRLLFPKPPAPPAPPGERESGGASTERQDRDDAFDRPSPTPSAPTHSGPSSSSAPDAASPG